MHPDTEPAHEEESDTDSPDCTGHNSVAAPLLSKEGVIHEGVTGSISRTDEALSAAEGSDEDIEEDTIDD